MTQTDLTTPKKKRKKPFSATAPSLKECKKRGWIAQVVEQNIRVPGGPTFKRDLFGVIDIVAITPSGILGIQATTGTNHSHRVVKALEEPRLSRWLESGGLFAVWSWSKRANGRWELREEEAVLKRKEQAA